MRGGTLTAIADQAAMVTAALAGSDQFHGMSSSQREAGQSFWMRSMMSAMKGSLPDPPFIIGIFQLQTVCDSYASGEACDYP